jgi:hypothetical protein
MTLRARLLRLLRVPPAPDAPSGDQEVSIFRASPNYFRYQLLRWGLKTAAAVAGLVFGVGMLRAVPGWLGGRFSVGPMLVTESLLALVLGLLEGAAILGFAIQALVSLALLRLDFEQRWYIVSDRSLRIREGLVRLHEKTMTFANLQNVSIRQGPLQRLLGIADLEVRTAGGGGSREDETESHDDLHVAYFRGVADAGVIRDTIRDRLRLYSDSGLGDPDDVRGAGEELAAAGDAAAVLTAAHSVLRETTLLRKQLGGPDREAPAVLNSPTPG